MQLRAPGHVRAVPGATHIAAHADHRRSPPRGGDGRSTPRSPVLPVREARAEPPGGTGQAVVFVEADCNGDISIKGDFSPSEALSA